MKIAEPLREGEFLRRYKRFFADVQIGGEQIVAHVANTGSLKTCLFAGAPCMISDSTNPSRKLKATLHFVKTPTSWVGVNTGLPNALVHEAWAAGVRKEWLPYKAAQREYKISAASRLDMVLAPSEADLANKRGLHFVEVKNVTYAEGEIALFPDAVSTRGQKHLEDLMSLHNQGFGAEIVFVVQRQDCRYFAPADKIDPAYGRLLRQARELGVRITALACTIDPQVGVTLNPVPLELDGWD
jgi:sugar fermentation stimulation protein A